MGSFAELKGGVGSAFGGTAWDVSLVYDGEDSPCGENGGVCANAADGPAGLDSHLDAVYED